MHYPTHSTSGPVSVMKAHTTKVSALVYYNKNGDDYFRPLEGKATNMFLLYRLIFDDIGRFTSDSTRKKLNQSVMKSIPIALPPLLEQRKMTAVLSVVQKAKERTEAVIDAATWIYQGTLNSFTP